MFQRVRLKRLTMMFCDNMSAYNSLGVRAFCSGVDPLSLKKIIHCFLKKYLICSDRFGDLLATPSDVDQLHQRAFAFLKQERETLPARLERG